MHDILGADDKVVSRWSASRIHVKSFLGKPPTRKEVRLKGISIYQLRDAMICKDWGEPDNLGFMTELGLVATVDLVGGACSSMRAVFDQPAGVLGGVSRTGTPSGLAKRGGARL